MARPGRAAFAGTAGNDDRSIDPETRFALRQPDAAAVTQLEQLVQAHQLSSAFALFNILAQPQGVWLTGGAPTEVAGQVEKTLRGAALEHARAVFVLYNIPGRDCGGYSAGD